VKEIEKKKIAQQITPETRSNQKEKISFYRFQYNLGIGTLFVQHTNFPDMCPAKVSTKINERTSFPVQQWFSRKLGRYVPPTIKHSKPNEGPMLDPL
jgi:hypothetical protein